MRRIAAIAGLVLFFGLSAATPQKLEHFFLPQAGTTWSATADSSARGDFFPHHVGDRWEYVDLNSSQTVLETLTRDSVGEDLNHYLFYNNSTSPKYRLDTASNVYWLPAGFSYNSLYYRLDADSGEAWTFHPYPNYIRWAWVAQVDSGSLFAHPTVRKIYRYSPGSPESTSAYLDERWLASGFGLIYTWREPNDITYLNGCIIAGDTFGIVTSTEVKEDEIPTSFVLKQNYPNPFNPSTTIELGLPGAGEVRLAVYNVLGQQLALLYEGRLTAGTHRIQWNAVGFATGTYICRLEGGGKRQTIKMLLMK